MPRRGASLVNGLSAGTWIQCAPRSNGTPNVCGVGDAAAADMVGRLEQHVAPAGGGDAARGGDAGRTGADDDDVDRARRRGARRRDGRTRRKRGRSGEERSAADFAKALRGMVSGCLRLAQLHRTCREMQRACANVTLKFQSTAQASA